MTLLEQIKVKGQCVSSGHCPEAKCCPLSILRALCLTDIALGVPVPRRSRSRGGPLFRGLKLIGQGSNYSWL